MNIDTLSIARELRAADLPSEQAEAIAAAIGRAVAESSATKADLDLAKAGLEAQMEQTRSGLDSRIEQTRSGLENKIEQVRSSLDSKIEQVRSSLDVKLEQVRTEVERARNQVVVGFVGTQIAFAGLIIGAIKFFSS